METVSESLTQRKGLRKITVKKHPDALVSFLEFSIDHVYKEKEKFEKERKMGGQGPL